MPTPPPPRPKPILVACLCADWCGTCRTYRTLFDQLTVQFAALRFVWIDVEDESDLVDPIEVEDFPTILIASSHHALFFGTVLPHMQTLQRLIEMHRTGNTPALPTDLDLSGLVDRLWQRAQSGGASYSPTPPPTRT
jgi:thioredoxin 1